jgi:hypothetical protein
MRTHILAPLFETLHARKKQSPKTEAFMRNSFTTALIVGAIALPLLALGSGSAHADTLKEVTTKGVVLNIGGMDVDVAYTPDGKFTAMEGQVTGTWRIDGETLCVTSNFQPQESCTLYPRDKKSGDAFDLTTDQGTVTIRIK